MAPTGKAVPNTTKQDVGIDAVAVRRSDGEHIAIQCKSRQSNASGQGVPISKGEIDSLPAEAFSFDIGAWRS